MKRLLVVVCVLLLFLPPHAAADDPVTWPLTGVRIKVMHDSSTPVSDVTLGPGTGSASDSWTFDLGKEWPGIGNASATLAANVTISGPTELTLNTAADFSASSTHNASTTGVSDGEKGRMGYDFGLYLPPCNEVSKREDSAGNTTKAAALSVQCQWTPRFAYQDKYEIGVYADTKVVYFTGSRVYNELLVTLIYSRPPANVRPIQGKVVVEGADVPGGRQPLIDAGVALIDANGQELERTITKADGSYWLAWAPEDTTVTVRAYLRNDNSYPPPVTFRYGQAPWDGVANPGPVVFAASPPVSVGRGASALQQDIVYSETSAAQPPPAIPHNRLDDLGLMYYRMHQAWELAGKLGPGLHLPVVVTAFSNQAGVYWSGPTNAWTPPGNQPVIINIAAGDHNSDSASGDTPDNREWHEFGHHVMADVLGNEMPTNAAPCPWPLPPLYSCNHYGYANVDTNDSWTEGFAEFYSMVVGREIDGKARPELYRWAGTQDNLESNYRAWTFTEHDLTRRGGVTGDEEFAAAGLLWDLLDPPDADDATVLYGTGGQVQKWEDCVQVGLPTLWQILTKDYGNTLAKSPAAPAAYGYPFDMKSVYDALKAAGIGQADSRAIGVSDLDEIFLSHGFFAERHEDDQFWQPGEEIGRAADIERPTRRDRTLPPGSNIAYTAQTVDGHAVNPPRFRVDVTFAAPFEFLGYSYTATPQTPGLLPFHAPDPQYAATASITAYGGGYQSVSPVTFDTRSYWQAMAANPQTSFMQAAFTVKKMPAVYLPLLFGQGGRIGAATTARAAAAAGAHTPRPCSPEAATPTPTPTATATPTSTSTPTPTATPTGAATATPTPTATATGVPAAKGIYGKVTFAGGKLPASLDLQLEAWDGEQWGTLLETSTDGNGEYLFTDAPTLGGGQAYRVGFQNGLLPEPDSRFLWTWYGRKIEAYTAGTDAPGGDFDVADVPLVSPVDGAAVTLPADFCWQPRGIAGDTYRVVFFSWDQYETTETKWLGNVNCAHITALPAGWPKGSAVSWWVGVGQGNPDAAPFNYGDASDERGAVIGW